MRMKDILYASCVFSFIQKYMKEKYCTEQKNMHDNKKWKEKEKIV